MLQLTAVEPLPGYRLRVAYADGVEGEVDLSDLVGKGVFALLTDPEVFVRVGIGPGGCIAWSKDLEICADAVYLKITRKRPEEVFQALASRGPRASQKR